jgi:hypothetical protein
MGVPNSNNGKNSCKCSLCKGQPIDAIKVLIPVKIIDEPQHRYKTLDEAAMDAARYIRKQALKYNSSENEYGITIYKKHDNKKGDIFYLTEMKQSQKAISPDIGDKTGKRGYTYVAHVHSHPHNNPKIQTFSMGDYISSYKDRIIINGDQPGPGITGYLVSNINNIKFIGKRIDCRLKIGEGRICEICLIAEPKSAEKLAECREKCEKCLIKPCAEKCTEIKDMGNVEEPTINTEEGVLMKFTPPPAPVNKGMFLWPSGSSNPHNIPQGCCRVTGDDERLKEVWEPARNNPYDIKSDQLRRRLFRTLVQLTAIIQCGEPMWYSGRDIVFPGR